MSSAAAAAADKISMGGTPSSIDCSSPGDHTRDGGGRAPDAGIISF